jgi:M6 family metalloprotease-like protein
LSQKKSISNNTNANNGIVNKLVVFVRFSDEPEFEDSLSVYEKIFNDSSTNSSSLYAYFKETSYGKLLVKSYFLPNQTSQKVLSCKVDKPRNYFENKNLETSDGENKRNELFYKTMNEVKNEIPATLELDFNRDGYIDDVCIIIKGSASPFMQVLSIHSGNYSNSGTPIKINGKSLGPIEIQLDYFTKKMGVAPLGHETLHILGSPDLFHYNFDGYDMVKNWDIMAGGPVMTHMCAYMKWQYGHWIDSIPEIRTSGSYSLKPLVYDSNNCYKISVNSSKTEYFVLEYRKRLGSFESTIPGDGLLVYRINSIYEGNGNRFTSKNAGEVYLLRPGGNLSEPGNILQANHSLQNGRGSINDNAPTATFLSNGAPAGIDISMINEIGDSILFEVTISAVKLPYLSIINSLIVNPNPASNYFIITIPCEMKSAPNLISVFDFTGRLVLSQSLLPMQQGETVTINLSNQPAGIYMVRLRAGKEEYSGKLELIK